MAPKDYYAVVRVWDRYGNICGEVYCQTGYKTKAVLKMIHNSMKDKGSPTISLGDSIVRSKDISFAKIYTKKDYPSYRPKQEKTETNLDEYYILLTKDSKIEGFDLKNALALLRTIYNSSLWAISKIDEGDILPIAIGYIANNKKKLLDFNKKRGVAQCIFTKEDIGCPNCGSEDMKCYSDHRPYDIQDNTCLTCGFYAYTNQGYMNLEELNMARAEEELEPLKELPLQEEV